jgi:hypothetical protein
MRVESKLARETAQIESIATASIQNNVITPRGSHLADAGQQRRGDAPAVQPAPSRDRRQCVARKFRSTLLRL